MDRPADIRGYRSKAINAAYAYTAANCPVGGRGISVSDTPAGRRVDIVGNPRASRPRSWDAELVPRAVSSSLMALDLHVYTAPVLSPDGAPVPWNPSAEGFGEDFAALDQTEADPMPTGETRLLVRSSEEMPEDGWIVVEANENFSAWRLALDSSRGTASGRVVPVADIAIDDGTCRTRPLHSGVVTFAAAHFGKAEGAEAAAKWNQTEEVPAVLSLDGETSVKVLVDSRGNIVSWTSAGSGEKPETPSNPYEPAPVCGHPLNGGGKSDDDHPLGGGSDSGGGAGNDGDNPLDSEGDGGYTPTCGGEGI